MTKKQCCQGNPFVGIAGTISGIMVAVVVMGLIFVRDSVVALSTAVAWPLVVLGVFMGLFAYKKK